jgi:hypothetical protein
MSEYFRSREIGPLDATTFLVVSWLGKPTYFRSQTFRNILNHPFEDLRTNKVIAMPRRPTRGPLDSGEFVALHTLLLPTLILVLAHRDLILLTLPPPC